MRVESEEWRVEIKIAAHNRLRVLEFQFPRIGLYKGNNNTMD